MNSFPSLWTRPLALCGVLGALVTSSAFLHAGTPSPTPAAPEADTRYGLFNGLDHRSQYGLGVFPEPFLVDDSDLEVNELRLDWFYAREPDSARNHNLKAEWEKGFGNLTVEIEVPFEIDTARGQKTVSGFDNIDVGARYPLYQFVSKNGLVDSTFGIAAEIGIPVQTTFSKNTEIVPKIFNDTQVGNFTIQTLVGYSMLRGGGGEDAGVDTLEYGFVLGYAFQKPFDGLNQLIPVFELSGEHQLNKDDSGHNSVTADAGFRFNLKAIGRWQPRLGVVYVFPLDKGARDELHSGIYTSLVFEF
ncbi:MAG: hypothetical protein JWO94_2342 [Verrucomicrobiaceae bacterium]|nr:hypothetical protein [Verrucomicrobiaceae bacterium]